MRGGYIKNIKKVKRDEKFAELIGILLGDGNICAYKKGRKIRVYTIKIVGNLKKDKNYIQNYVGPLIKKVFGVKASYYKHNNGIYTVAYGLKIIQVLEKEGLVAGDKIKNKVTIPSWIFKNKRDLSACIRGLYNTDGCIYELKTHWPGIYQISFDNRNMILLKDLKKALEKIGIKSSKIHGKKAPKGTKIDITAKKEVIKFIEKIGSNNDRLNKKIKEIKRKWKEKEYKESF